jgi:ABC-2 type transport system ATP-binding protein
VNETAGRVTVFGHDIHRDWRAARECIGLVPQEFNFNVWEPVIEILVNQAGYYGIKRGVAFGRAEYCLKTLDLWEKRRHMARSLSGGMKRRLMIARALVHEPRLLILDEPTAGVDIEIRRSTWRFLRELNASGTTIILTTHYLEEAESLCRNIAIINHGEIVEHSAMSVILRRLHLQTFVLNVADRLEQAPTLEGYATRKIDDHTLEVDVPIEKGVNGVFDGLTRVGIETVSLRNKSNRLEELFLRLVDGRG